MQNRGWICHAAMHPTIAVLFPQRYSYSNAPYSTITFQCVTILFPQRHLCMLKFLGRYQLLFDHAWYIFGQLFSHLSSIHIKGNDLSKASHYLSTVVGREAIWNTSIKSPHVLVCKPWPAVYQHRLVASDHACRLSDDLKAIKTSTLHWKKKGA